MSCKGCLAELLLGCTMLAIAVSFVWAVETQPLEQFGTVTHQTASGEQKENPICIFPMIGMVGSFVIIAAAMLARSEKKVIEAGASAGAADPIAPATQAARSGCGTAFAWLAVLGVCGVLATVFSLVTRGGA